MQTPLGNRTDGVPKTLEFFEVVAIFKRESFDRCPTTVQNSEARRLVALRYLHRIYTVGFAALLSDGGGALGIVVRMHLVQAPRQVSPLSLSLSLSRLR